MVVVTHNTRTHTHTLYLYEGRRDRISLRFWESVTLSTDSCESSLSAMVEIWKKTRQTNESDINALKKPSYFTSCKLWRNAYN